MTNIYLAAVVEIKRNGRWYPVHIITDLPIRIVIRCAFVFAKQQEIDFNNVRVKRLKTDIELLAAKTVIKNIEKEIT